DATFIHSDPGHASADTPRGEEAKTRRNKDGTWTKKGGKSHFGYKLHAVMDRDHDLIRRICTTTASVHDSQIDLSENGEVVYRDRGYQGASCNGYNATMKRGARGHPVGIKDKLRNRRISKKRAKGERPFAVIKNVFNAGKVMVTTLERVKVKCMFSAFCYNLYQLRSVG
ncbi:MAG TPA: transposase, partial [Methanolinea sp.]|nr:transposase [Methanolinea sp.]